MRTGIFPTHSSAKNMVKLSRKGEIQEANEWTTRKNAKYGRENRFNKAKRSSSWDKAVIDKIADVIDSDSLVRCVDEKQKAKVDAPYFPRLIASVDVIALVRRLREENAFVQEFRDSSEFKILFTLPDEATSNITRAFQEDQILKTRLKLKRGDNIVDVPSFWDIWFRDKKLRKRIISSKDPSTQKWRCAQEFGYKMATTFMPGYAKAIYKLFDVAAVLDPCSGWGDRMLGAAVTDCVCEYVGFDPNYNLRPGYVETLAACGHSLISIDHRKLQFSNGFTIISEPFETGALHLGSNAFDLVFTSPPFFLYEEYSRDNPTYSNWIEEFYQPLMIHSCRCVKPGGHVAIYISDTSAGEITPFMTQTVELITPLKLVYRIGFVGIVSGKIRGVWVYRKPEASNLTSGVISSYPLYEEAVNKSVVEHDNSTSIKM